jgi:membrane protease YdiL (CAAX protease family)
MTRTFSLAKYLLVVCALSWPFQSFVFFYPDSTWAFRLLLVSMVMAGGGTFIYGKYNGDSFSNVGWSLGKWSQYVAVFALAAFLWLLPSLLWQMFANDRNLLTLPWLLFATTFLGSFLLTFIPAFGEEFSWRGYLLPKLAERYSTRKALLLHGVVTWFWHWPFLIFMGTQSPALPEQPALSVLLVLGVSLIPATLHAVVFAYIWKLSGSILVVTVYHAAFDEIRDTTTDTLTIGPWAEPWQVVVLTILGIVILVGVKKNAFALLR